jgi:hypothetical protein
MNVVRSRYITQETERFFLRCALDFFTTKADPSGNKTWRGMAPRPFVQLPLVALALGGAEELSE